jgi:hypothetical protein
VGWARAHRRRDDRGTAAGVIPAARPGRPASATPMLGLDKRGWNILTRTAHIAVTGALFGGHVFHVDPDRLLPWLYAVIASGAVLLALEAGWRPLWFHQGRGLAVMAKLALLLTVPTVWPWRVPILAAVIVIASVGSHMPGRFRYYSVLRGEIVKCRDEGRPRG